MKQLLRRITNIGARSNGALGTSSTVFNLSLDHMLGADQGKATSSLQLSDKHKGSSLSANSAKTNASGSDSEKQVPVILQRFVEYLSSPEALETEGLFRIAAPVKQVKELRESIEKNGLAELSKLDPYDGINIVASLFKQWLRDIPEGVVPKSHFQKLVDCGASPSKLQAVLRTLPKPNLDFLEYLLKYLYKVVSHSSKNLMTVQNLVIVFAPNLFSCPSAPSVVSSGNPEKYLVESMQVTKIMANIMENYEEIFQGPKTKHSNRNSSSSRQSATLLNEEYEPIIPPFTRIKLNDELDESENDTSKIRPPPIPTAQQDQLIKQAVSDTVSSMLFPNTKRTTGPMSPSKSYNALSKENSILLAELKKKLGHHSNQPQNIEDVVQNHSILSETDEIPAIQAESHVPQSENTPILTSVTKSRPKPPGRRPPAAPVDPSLRNALIFDKSAPVSPTARKAVLLEDTQPILPIEVLDEPILQIRESSTEALDGSKKKSVTFLDHDKNIERKKASSPIPPPPNKPAPPIPTSQSKKPQSRHAHNSTELLHKEIDRSNSVESMRLVYILSDKDSKKLIEEEFRSLKSKIKLLRSTGAEIHKADRLRYKHLSGLIKELNQDGDLSTTSLPPNQDTGSMSTLQISAKSSLERLARKRLRERRPKDIQDMSVEQLMEEKTAVKRELAHLKTQFKESSNLYTPEDKEIMRELYSRYCDIKSCIESRMDSSCSLRMSTDEIRVSNSELEQYALLRHEKKILQLQLHKFQDNFIKENGRRVKTADDRAPVQAEYKRYKELRSIIDEMENRLKLEVNDDEDS
ncbi:hypothetical protein HDU99_003274 [Rhizoclosmatium hyalinum]|nr:hypothetical protein HDU99_003274 [Rhizoclosmatium hyalinum]